MKQCVNLMIFGIFNFFYAHEDFVVFAKSTLQESFTYDVYQKIKAVLSNDDPHNKMTPKQQEGLRACH